MFVNLHGMPENSFVDDKKYNIGLALGGGGARGFAHLGVLKAMEELGIKPDIISGVSAGSIVAALYAAGFPVDVIFKAFTSLSLTDLTELSVPRCGFFSLNKLRTFLRRILPVENIEDLHIPTRIIATNIDKSEPVVFDHGPISERVIASCSIPVIFKPAKIDGVNYVDGGLLHNLPTTFLRDDCRVLIGVNVSPICTDKVKQSLIGVAQRTFEMMARTNAVPDSKLCDVLVEPSLLADINVFNLKNGTKILRIGYDSAMEVFKNSETIKKIIHND